MKKRMLSLLLSVSMMLTALPLNVFATAQKEKNLYGDVDGNGRTDLEDLLLIEKYISGEEHLNINLKNADINSDGAVDKTDAELLREHLVSNIDDLTPDLCTLSFDTDGGDAIAPMQTGKGYTIKTTIPQPAKAGYIFVKWVKENGDPFYQDKDVITADMKLKAVYEPVEARQTLSINSFSLDDQPTDVSFDITGDVSSTSEVKAGITLLSKDGSDPVAIDVKSRGGNVYTVYAPEGFRAGSTYGLTLNAGLSFVGKEDMFRTVYFMIQKDEIDNIKFSEDVVFIKDTDEMNYTIDDKTLPVLESALLSNDTSDKAVQGTFSMSNATLVAGDIVCIYENIHPDSRDYTKNDYDDDALAYVRILSVSGDTYEFESLDENDANQVLAIPDTIAYHVDVLPTDDGTVKKSDYDGYVRNLIGKTDAPEFKQNDFLVFYRGSIETASESGDFVYGQITGTDETTVSYKIVAKNDIESFMDLFVSREIAAQDIIDAADESEILRKIEKQAKESGFAEEAANHMVKNALESENVQKKLLENGISSDEIEQLALPLQQGGRGGTSASLSIESQSVIPSLAFGKHFDNGVGVILDLTLVLSIDIKTTSKAQGKLSTETSNSLKIALTASFEEELSFGMDADVDIDIDWYLFIPVLDDLDVGVSVDIKNYSSISVGAKIYTISNGTTKKWKALNESILGVDASDEAKETLRKINKLAGKAKKLAAKGEDVKEVYNQIKAHKDSLPSITVDGETYSVEELEKELNAEDAGSSFEDVIAAEDQSQAKTGLEQLMNRYNEMLDQECNWIDLVNYKLFEKEFHIKVVAIKLGVHFVVGARVNIALGADVEYEVGKRYSFWLHVLDGKAGSSEIDLIDERFGFQFYVMGEIGLRLGIKASIDIGLLTTDLASIGANVEFGPYLRLWGYFMYVYERMRPVYSKSWNEQEEMLGAMYLEFGLYLKVKFKAQVFADSFKFEPTLYDGEFPLLNAGERKNVYDFAYQEDPEDILYITDVDGDSTNGITMQLPEQYRNMKTIDLCEGNREQSVYPLNHFNISFTNPAFSINQDGILQVKVPVGERYIKGNMRIVWKCDKLSFSKYDTDITIPIVWTNMDSAERKQKFTVEVAVGNETDGYQTIWSERHSRMDTFDLPSNAAILGLINYERYNTDAGNIKYKSVEGYAEKATGLKVTSDRTFYFTVTPHIYTLTVNGIEKADGSTESRTYTTEYGKEFDLQELRTTGTNDSKNGNYTSWSGFSDEQGALAETSIAADADFFSKYGSAAELTADYRNDALDATYTFVGVEKAMPVTVKFKRGTAPVFAGMSEYLMDHVGEGVLIREITPKVAPSESAVNYTVICDYTSPKAMYRLTYETNGGEVIEAQKYAEGSSLGMAPCVVSRAGYTFIGWYRDAGLTDVFDLKKEVMPDHDLTIYAKWAANQYTVRLDPIHEVQDASGTAIADLKMQVTFDKAYGTLPQLKHDKYMFLGWYMQKQGGTKVTAATILKTNADHTLYAHWQEKYVIDPDWITYGGVAVQKMKDKDNNDVYAVTEQRKTDYNKTGQPLTLTLSEDCPFDKEQIIQGIKVEYKWQSSDKHNEADTNMLYTTEAPINAGIYDVKISRPTDDAFASVNEMHFVAAIRIDQIKLPELSIPTVFTNAGVAAVRSSDNIEGDGAITYQIVETRGTKEYESTNGFFTDLPAGYYSAYVHVAAGTNYLAGESPKAYMKLDGIKSGFHKAQFNFKTWNNGTDGNVNASVTYYNPFPQTIDKKGLGEGIRFDDDDYFTEKKRGEITPAVIETQMKSFKSGNVQNEESKSSFEIIDRIVPWQLDSYTFNKDGGDVWTFTAHIAIYNGESLLDGQYIATNTRTGKGVFAYPQGVTDWKDDVESSGQINFLRNISAVGDFFDGESIWDVSKGEPYTYSYNSKITDQYMGEYNPMDYYSAPKFYVSSGNVVYDTFVHYTGVTAFEIDTTGLMNYFKEYNKKKPDSLSYTIYLDFPDRTTAEGSRIFTREIQLINFATENAEDFVTEDGNTKASSAMAELSHMLSGQSESRADVAAVKLMADLSAVQDSVAATMTLSASAVAVNRGKDVDISLQVDNDTSIWGILAGIDFDPEVFALAGHMAGNLFSEEQFTFQKNTEKAPYKLLATMDTMDTISAKGNLITLRFRVKDNAAAKPTAISIHTIDAVDQTGSVAIGKGDAVNVTASIDSNEKADVDAGVNSPTTGEDDGMRLWISLLFVFGCVPVICRCKKRGNAY